MNRRAGTVISETWEDGQALKDINAQLVSLVFFCSLVVIGDFNLQSPHELLVIGSPAHDSLL